MAMSPMGPLTKLPLCSLLVGVNILKLILHLLETIECLQEPTIVFQNMADNAIQDKLWNRALNRNVSPFVFKTTMKSIP